MSHAAMCIWWRCKNKVYIYLYTIHYRHYSHHHNVVHVSLSTTGCSVRMNLNANMAIEFGCINEYNWMTMILCLPNHVIRTWVDSIIPKRRQLIIAIIIYIRWPLIVFLYRKCSSRKWCTAFILHYQWHTIIPFNWIFKWIIQMYSVQQNRFPSMLDEQFVQKSSNFKSNECKQSWHKKTLFSIPKYFDFNEPKHWKPGMLKCVSFWIYVKQRLFDCFASSFQSNHIRRNGQNVWVRSCLYSVCSRLLLHNIRMNHPCMCVCVLAFNSNIFIWNCECVGMYDL